MEVVALGQSIIRSEREALLATSAGRAAAIQELMTFKESSRQRRITPKELIASVATLSPELGEIRDAMTADALRLFNSTHWNRVREAVDKCNDRGREKWEQYAKQLGEIVGVLVSRHRAMMHKIALEYHGRTPLSVADLVSEMILIIPAAIERYDPDRGAGVLTALTWSFRQAALRAMEKEEPLKVPKRTFFVRKRISEIYLECDQAQAPRPSNDELAKMLDVPRETVGAALSRTISLDEPAGGDYEGMTYAEVIGGVEEVDHVDATYLIATVQDRIARLHNDQRKCLMLRIPCQVQTGITSLPLTIDDARRRLVTRSARIVERYVKRTTKAR